MKFATLFQTIERQYFIAGSFFLNAGWFYLKANKNRKNIQQFSCLNPHQKFRESRENKFP